MVIGDDSNAESRVGEARGLQEPRAAARVLAALLAARQPLELSALARAADVDVDTAVEVANWLEDELGWAESAYEPTRRCALTAHGGERIRALVGALKVALAAGALVRWDQLRTRIVSTADVLRDALAVLVEGEWLVGVQARAWTLTATGREAAGALASTEE